ncbi:hypothetical protein ACFSLT_20695 [Novosphingobium resinovorum]
MVLLRGSDAAEAQGQTLVANVILRTDAGGSGNAALTMTHTADGVVSPAYRVSFARRVAGWQTSIELSGEVTRYPTDGVYLDRDATGTLTSTRREHIRAKAPEYGLALSTSGAVAGGTLTVNLRLNKDGYSSDRGIDIFKGAANGSPDGRRDIAYDENGRSGELGLDWTRRLGSGWTAKLVGLGRVERYVTDEDYVEADYRGLSSQRETPSEFVARVTVTREGDHSVRPEFGGEVAYNRLSSLLDYAEDTGSGLMPVALANADTRVSELRGEAFANITVKFAPGLRWRRAWRWNSRASAFRARRRRSRACPTSSLRRHWCGRRRGARSCGSGCAGPSTSSISPTSRLRSTRPTGGRWAAIRGCGPPV